MSSQNTKGCLIVIGLFVGLGVMGTCSIAWTNRQIAKAEERETQIVQKKQKEVADRFAAMTPQDHLAQAEKLIGAGNGDAASKELRAVPDGTPGLSEVKNKLSALVAKQRAERAAAKEAKLKQDAKDLKELRAKLKKQGVRIGMTQAEVLLSSWGKPESVNRTTGSYGVHEQWVYSGHHSYLYFEDGILTSIQN